MTKFSINQTQQQQIRQATIDLEGRSDVELVTLIQYRADSYYFIPALWAALAALVLPPLLMLSPFWLDGLDLLQLQWLSFALLLLLLQIPALKYRLVPRWVKRQRAAASARAQFLALGLHRTQAHTGMLLFVSQAEHYVEILVDQGIADTIDSQQWQAIIDGFVLKIKSKQISDGFLNAIAAIDRIVSQSHPLSHQHNELPDQLVILE